MSENQAQKRRRVERLTSRLKKCFPEAKCALHHQSAWELLAATILSAQCTDERVNFVTLPLFKRYPDVRDFAEADLGELEGWIRSTGFYKNKARNIQGAAQGIVERFGGEVPSSMEDLITLPGVGRKTANVVLGTAYGIPGLTVDTHMIRLNRRLGLTRHKDPVKIEQDLMKLVPQKNWTLYSHLIIMHGRQCCFARKPQCEACSVALLCPSQGKA